MISRKDARFLWLSLGLWILATVLCVMWFSWKLFIVIFIYMISENIRQEVIKKR